MNIKPSAAIRQNYNEIAELCRSSQEPVYLTKNGEGDLVVMDLETFTRREKMLKLREELLRVEEDRLHGARDYTIEEVSAMMKEAIDGVCHAGAPKGLNQRLLDNALLHIQGQLTCALLRSTPAHTVCQTGNILYLFRLNPFRFFWDRSTAMMNALCHWTHFFYFT